MDILVDNEQKAKENRDRVAAERNNKPYYWWEYPDPFPRRAAHAPVSNPKGLARSRQELIDRQKE